MMVTQTFCSVLRVQDIARRSEESRTSFFSSNESPTKRVLFEEEKLRSEFRRNGPLVKWSRRRPLTPQSGVRLSHGSPSCDVPQHFNSEYLASAIYIVGAFSGEGPPVPIPNTEVKLTYADNTCLETDREDRSAPTLNGARYI